MRVQPLSSELTLKESVGRFLFNTVKVGASSDWPHSIRINLEVSMVNLACLIVTTDFGLGLGSYEKRLAAAK